MNKRIKKKLTVLYVLLIAMVVLICFSIFQLYDIKINKENLLPKIVINDKDNKNYQDIDIEKLNSKLAMNSEIQERTNRLLEEIKQQQENQPVHIYFVNTTPELTRTKVYSAIEVNGPVPLTTIDELANELINSIPSWLLQDFINNNWKVCITNKEIATRTYKGKAYPLLAFSSAKDKMIVLEERGIHKILPYMFGLYIADTYWGSTYNNEEFDNIYNEEIEQFQRNIRNLSASYSKKEFFAQTFAYMLTDYQNCTPKAYNYVFDICKDYVNKN